MNPRLPVSSPRALLLALTVSAINIGGTVLLAGGSDPASAAPAAQAPAASCVPLTNVQRRILSKATEGMDALRRFVYITKGIYQLDMTETVAWIGAYRAKSAECAPPRA
jgi:hypothetical protein